MFFARVLGAAWLVVVVAGCAAGPELPGGNASAAGQEVPAFDDAALMGRFVGILERTLPTKLPPSPAEPEDYGASWQGLAVRIDAATVTRDEWGVVASDECQVLARVKNLGGKAIQLPGGWRRGLDASMQHRDGTWTDLRGLRKI